MMGRVLTVCVNMWKRTLETGGNKVVFKKQGITGFIVDDHLKKV